MEDFRKMVWDMMPDDMKMEFEQGRHPEKYPVKNIELIATVDEVLGFLHSKEANFAFWAYMTKHGNMEGADPRQKNRAAHRELFVSSLNDTERRFMEFFCGGRKGIRVDLPVKKPCKPGADCLQCKYGWRDSKCGANTAHCSLSDEPECKPEWRGAEE